MTHVFVVIAKVRKNERLWHTLNMGDMCGPNSRGAHCTKHVQVYVSAQKGY